MVIFHGKDYSHPHNIISRCIELNPCRYDGSKIPSPAVAHFRPFPDCIPVYSEVEIDLGIPREKYRIWRMDGFDHLLQTATGRDVTGEMTACANQFLDSLPPIDGFILKVCSPTTGTSDVRVYPSSEKSKAIDRSADFFARELLKRISELPIQDELCLNNTRNRVLTGIFTLAAFRYVEERSQREDLAT